MAKPTLRTPEVVEHILEGLSAGTPLAVICREEGMPAERTFREWGENDKQLSADIARAREAGFDAIALNALRIADDGSGDTWIDDEGNERVNSDHIQRSKLRVETRLKLLAKWDPKRYGDKLDVTSGGEKLPNVAVAFVRPNGDNAG